MDQGKVTVVTTWPTPISVKDVQCFIGFINFYQRFIKRFSSIAALLTVLLNSKLRRLKWTLEAKKAFLALKQAFMTAPILHHPASENGVGAVLSQRFREKAKMYPVA